MKPFYKKEKKGIFGFHFIAASVFVVAYCIPMLSLMFNPDFENVWLLYLGNALFLFGTLASVILFNSMLKGNVSFTTLISSGLLTTVMSIVAIILVILVTILMFFPAIFGAGIPKEALRHAPVNMVEGRTNGLMFIIFMNAIFVNFAAGGFASFIAAVTSKRNQTTSSGKEVDVTIGQ